MSPLVLPHWSATIGRAFFATAVMFFGAQHLFYGEFVTRIVPPWPDWIPARPLWAMATGVLLIGAGAALCFRRTAHHAALILGTTILAFGVVLAVPLALRDPSIGSVWTKAGKALALGGGAFVVAATLRASVADPWHDRLLAIGRASIGGFFVLCGIRHFIWAQFVATLVPAWIPGAMFWTYFAGIALIAAGLGLWLHRTMRLAALLSSLMIFLWVLMLHLPRALANLADANEATAVFEALALSGLTLLLAGSPPGAQPGFGSGRTGDTRSDLVRADGSGS